MQASLYLRSHYSAHASTSQSPLLTTDVLFDVCDCLPCSGVRRVEVVCKAAFELKHRSSAFPCFVAFEILPHTVIIITRPRGA
jgi:hypothetical protein